MPSSLASLVPSVLLGVVLSVVPAAAQSNVAIAEKLFREAQDAMKGGRFPEACAKFAESNRADPQLGTLLNLADCHEKEGKPASAWTTYTTLADLAAQVGDNKRADYAKKRATALEPSLPQLALHAGGVKVLDVRLDEQPISLAALATTIPVDPGKHVLAFTTKDRRWTQPVEVPSTGTVGLEVTIPKDAIVTSVATPPQSPPIVPPPPPTRSSPLRPVGVVLMIVGVGGLAVGSVFGVIAINDKTNVEMGCTPTGVCNVAGYNASVTAHTDAWASTIGFIAGGVLAAAGLTLFILGATKKPYAALSAPLTFAF
jgi:hypothetical protein